MTKSLQNARVGSLDAQPPASAGADGVPSSPETIGARVAEDLVAGHFASIVARMSPEMAAAMPASKIEAVWLSLTKDLGALPSRGTANSERRADVTIVRIPLKFHEATLDLKLALVAETIVGFFLVPHAEPVPAWVQPDYADVEAFQEIEVHFGPDAAPLPATLTLPRGVETPPVAILVHGSGLGDRDESIGPNRPFKDLAVGLATRGVATLRYDKRTLVYPQSFAHLKAPTVRDEVLDDVDAAVAYLAKRPEVDARRIVVVGRSLGGTLSPRAATENPAIAAIAILAGATRPLPDLVVEQTEYLAARGGTIGQAEAAQIAALNAEAARVRAARPGDQGAPFLGAPLSWWADLNTYDPAATAARLMIPILVLQGARDYQVGLADFERFQAALRGRGNAELRLFGGLNHYFMAGSADSVPSEYQTPGHVDVEVIDAVAKFIHAN